MVERQRIVEWLQRPVRIPSVGPRNAGPRSGAIDEGRIAAQAATWLEALGGKVVSEDVYPGRPNTRNASSSSNALASFRSSVSKPSVNQSFTRASKSRASACRP